MTVKILLLKSGEDVIADVKEMVSPDKKVIGYFLKKPCIVKLIPKNKKERDLHINVSMDASCKRERYTITN